MRTFLLFSVFVTSTANAADLCELYEEYCPGYVRSVVSGSSYASFSDTLNVNPASLPTIETPVGAELIHTNKTENSNATTNFALIKGYKHGGFGISNHSDRTFYTYNLQQGLQGSNYKTSINGYQAGDSVMSSLNFGADIAPFTAPELSFLNSPNIGLNLRYNETTKKWDLQYGVSLVSKAITLGASYRKSVGVNTGGISVPTISTTSFNAGFKLGILAVEYTLLYLRTPDTTLQNYSFFSRPVRIISASTDIRKLHIFVAHREAYNVLDQLIKTNLYGAQFEILKGFSLAYQRNYIPGANSLSAQYLF